MLVNTNSPGFKALALSFVASTFFSGALAQNSTDLGSCLESAGIESSLPSSSTFATDILPWQSRILPVPAAVAYPRNEEEVTKAIECASAAGVKVTTLGGNRSFSSLGFGRDDGALIVSLKHLIDMSVDQSTGDFTFGGGVTISRAVNFLWQTYGRAIVHGRCPDVGLSGVALGGGFGTLSRLLGTPMDNMVSARAVLSDGSVVTASETENTDLFWALRGAAPSFAVVTQVTLKTWKPISQLVTNYTLASAGKASFDQSAEALLAVQDWATSEDNSDLLSMRWTISDTISAKGFFYGPPEEFNTTMAPLMANLPNLTLTSTVQDFMASEETSTPGTLNNTDTPRRYFFILSATVDRAHPFTLTTAKALYDSTAGLPKRNDSKLSGFLDLWGGAVSAEISDEDTAWKHGNDLWLVRYDARSDSFDVPFGSDLIGIFKASWEKFLSALRATGWTDRSFLNYRSSEWSQDEMAENLYGDANWARLLELKRTFDPIGLFNTDRNQSIPLVL